MSEPYLPRRWHITTPDRTGDPKVFPRMIGQQFLASKGPVWDTAVYTSRSGRRWASSNWTYPIWRWSVPYEFLRRQLGRDELGQLWSFFNMRKGRGGEFLFLDDDDCAVDHEVFGLGDGSTTTFQLTRSLLDWTEPVRALNGRPEIYVGDVLTSALSVDDYAVVTFDVAPADGVRLDWTGSYYFRCAFTQDSMLPSQMFRRHWELSKVEFETIK